MRDKGNRTFDRSTNLIFRTFFVPFCVLCGYGAAVAGEQDGGSNFDVRQLVVDNNEGCAIADVNNDEQPDIIAGRYWYEGPDFEQHPLREIAPFGEDYIENNGDHAMDVDGDGWVDVVTSSFIPREIYWFRNPGREGLRQENLWERHPLAEGATNNEITFLHDLNGDGTPEFVVDSWDRNADMQAWRFVERKDGPALELIPIGTGANGHGMGFGDVNGDGRTDILFARGWYEQPDDQLLESAWQWHQDWDWGQASCPVLVVDLNGDGRNDLIRGKAHDYGLYWMEQLEPADGKTTWQEHLIDDSYSQPHCLHWADLNGDGQGELITGKRVRAHSGGDPGAAEPPCLYYYQWDNAAQEFNRHIIEEGHVGTGLQIRTADLDGDGRLDIVTPGKSGTHVLLNRGGE